MLLGQLLKSLAAGLVGMGILASAAFLILPRSFVTIGFIMPGVPLVPVVGAVIPDSIVYRLAPDGGLMATLIAAPSAAVVWTVLLAFIWHALQRWRKATDSVVEGSPQ